MAWFLREDSVGAPVVYSSVTAGDQGSRELPRAQDLTLGTSKYRNTL